MISLFPLKGAHHNKWVFGLGPQLKIEMLSMHADDDGSTENILNLSEAELAIRKVDMVDIAFDDVSDQVIFPEQRFLFWQSKYWGICPCTVTLTV